MTLDRTAPAFKFATTETVKALCPVTIVEKEIEKTLGPENFIPARTQEKDTGYDVRCADPKGVTLIPGHFFKMKLGFRMHAPDGWWMSLVPRSGTFANKHIHPLYGVIDELYENEMCFVGQYLPCNSVIIPANLNPVIQFGERIAQVIPVPRWEMKPEFISNEEMDALNAARGGARGLGGFGSSGNV